MATGPPWLAARRSAPRDTGVAAGCACSPSRSPR